MKNRSEQFCCRRQRPNGPVPSKTGWKEYLVFSVVLFVAWNSLSFAQIPFSEPIAVVQPIADSPDAVVAADLDGDGDMDILSASTHDNKIAWYENIDGKGTFGDQKVITTQAMEAMSVCTADLDGDGDLDVISGFQGQNAVAWYENTDGYGTFGEERTITTGYSNVRSVYAVDLDGDGDMDVLSAGYNEDKIAWYENTDGEGTFGAPNAIESDIGSPMSVYAVDLDGDGDMDVLSAFQGDDMISWYENTDGKGRFGSGQIITTDADGALAVYAADLDKDGDLDVLSASTNDNKIAWYENTDGTGTFGAQRIVTTQAQGANSIFTADLDGDGDQDVLSTSYNDGKIAWYRNTDGRGIFGAQRVITADARGATAVCAADLDGDWDMDVISASWVDNKIAWYENADGLGTFGGQKLVTGNENGAESFYTADMDGDGDQDLLAVSYFEDKISWYENTDGKGQFGNQVVITTKADGAMAVFAADLDGDGDKDVLSASEIDGKIAWYKNIDGAGAFLVQQTITTNAPGTKSVYAADLDKDGYLDVLSACYNGIAWYRNRDGAGNFGSLRNITTTVIGGTSVYVADLDGDGDQDVLSASSYDGKIAWYKNTDGKGTFGGQQVITTQAAGAEAVYAVDLDGDGDLDVLSASEGDGKVAWYENTDGKGAFGEQRIITDSALGAWSVHAADFDRDGDMDVVAASKYDNTVAWYENTDGKGTFDERWVLNSEAYGARTVLATDVDGDQDMDVLSGDEYETKIVLYRNLYFETLVPNILVSPSSCDYRSVAFKSSVSKTFSIVNSGRADLIISTITVVGDPDFVLEDSLLGEFSIAPGAVRDISVRFSPLSGGLKSAILRFENNDPDENPYDVFLSGFGLAADISVLPASWNFGGVAVSSSASKTFSVFNTGDMDLRVDSTIIVGDGDFIITGGTGGSFTLHHGAVHSITVQFGPLSDSSKSAILYLYCNDPDENPCAIPLAGTGLYPDISLSPESWDYGSVFVDSAAIKTIVVTNAGSVVLIVDSVKIVEGGDFTLAGGSEGPFTLAPGVEHHVTVRFQPSSQGSKSAVLRFVSNDPDENPYDVGLTGTGTGQARLCVSPNMWDFGDAYLDSVKAKTFQVKSTGTCDLNVSSVIVIGDSDFSIIDGFGNGFTLCPGDSHAVTVQFSPSSTGEKSAMLRFQSNDYDTLLCDVDLKGKVWETGVDGEVSRPEAYVLHPNFPNPFNPLTEIRYEIPKNSFVSIAVYNMNGQKIKTLISEYRTAGSHQVHWDAMDDSGKGVGSGVYIIVMTAENRRFTRTAVFTK